MAIKFHPPRREVVESAPPSDKGPARVKLACGHVKFVSAGSEQAQHACLLCARKRKK